MRRVIWGGLLAVLAALGLTAAARAEMVLVWSTGNRDTTAQVAAWIQASGHFTSVVGVDRNTTFTLPELLAFDRVLYFSSTSQGQNPTAIGNVLADYADAGRPLVLTTFSWANQGTNTLAGRIINEGISPFVLQGSSLYRNVTIGGTDGSEFFAGVNSINGVFHDDVRLTANATLHGTWSDGSPLLASKNNVVAVNLFPDDTWGSVSGDHRQLFINALLNAGGSGEPPVPEPATLTLLGVGAAGLLGYGWRRRRQTV